MGNHDDFNNRDGDYQIKSAQRLGGIGALKKQSILNKGKRAATGYKQSRNVGFGGLPARTVQKLGDSDDLIDPYQEQNSSVNNKGRSTSTAEGTGRAKADTSKTMNQSLYNIPVNPFFSYDSSNNQSKRMEQNSEGNKIKRLLKNAYSQRD